MKSREIDLIQIGLAFEHCGELMWLLRETSQQDTGNDEMKQNFFKSRQVDYLTMNMANECTADQKYIQWALLKHNCSIVLSWVVIKKVRRFMLTVFCFRNQLSLH